MSVDYSIRILVVDDNTGIRLIAKKIIKNLGFENVDVADDGTTALEKLKKNPVDLVIADWQMPKMSGMDLLKAMRSNDKLKDTLFILVTAEDDQETIMEAIRAGINSFMKKPYDAKILLSKIERVFAFQEELKLRKARGNSEEE